MDRPAPLNKWPPERDATGRQEPRMPATRRRKPIQLGTEDAYCTAARARINPFTPRTMAWAHYLIGYQYG